MSRTFYIDSPEIGSSYSALQPCASNPVSTLIRGMNYGCGIDPSTSYTSFNCFCTSSKSQLQWTLQSLIMDDCSTTPGGDVTASVHVTSALGLYNSYCQLPLMAAATRKISQRTRLPCAYHNTSFTDTDSNNDGHFGLRADSDSDSRWICGTCGSSKYIASTSQ